MIDVGRYNTLTIQSVEPRGAWLTDGEDRIWLSADRGPDDEPTEGESIKVFVYSDGSGEPVATTEEPAAIVGDFALLEVIATSPHGAFLDWGLDKDLLVPTFEQYRPLRVGDRVVVKLMLDRDHRVMAVSKLTHHFDKRTERLEAGQPVDILVYGSFERGLRCVVDGRYSGVLFHDQTFTPLHLGDSTRGWIVDVREDGRLNLSLRPPGRSAAADARSVLIAAIKAADGFLPLTDKSSPTAIKHSLHLSKKQFKRAVGNLYRDRKITIEDNGLRWRED